MLGWFRSILFNRKSLLAFGLLIFITGIYILGWSSLLTVKSVVVLGAPTRQDRELLAKEISIGDRLARIDTNALESALDKYSWLRESSLEKNWFKGKVTIKVKTRIPIASYGDAFLDSSGKLFTLPHRERFRVPIILATTAESRKFASTLISNLPNSFRKYVTRLSVDGMQSATLTVEDTSQVPVRRIAVKWGDFASTLLKIAVYQSLLALPENSKISMMDLSAPHAPIVK